MPQKDLNGGKADPTKLQLEQREDDLEKNFKLAIEGLAMKCREEFGDQTPTEVLEEVGETIHVNDDGHVVFEADLSQ